MKKHNFGITFIIFLFVQISFISFSQSCVGVWETFNEKTGEKESIVEFYKKGDQLFGKIVKLFPVGGVNVDMLCELCTDERKGKPVQGMEVFKNLKWDGSTWYDGKGLYPAQGKQYVIKLWLDPKNSNLLKVRGYLGPFFSTQTWRRQ